VNRIVWETVRFIETQPLTIEAAQHHATARGAEIDCDESAGGRHIYA
jgi:hypothetical protein